MKASVSRDQYPWVEVTRSQQSAWVIVAFRPRPTMSSMSYISRNAFTPPADVTFDADPSHAGRLKPYDWAVDPAPHDSRFPWRPFIPVDPGSIRGDPSEWIFPASEASHDFYHFPSRTIRPGLVKAHNRIRAFIIRCTSALRDILDWDGNRPLEINVLQEGIVYPWKTDEDAHITFWQLRRPFLDCFGFISFLVWRIEQRFGPKVSALQGRGFCSYLMSCFLVA